MDHEIFKPFGPSIVKIKIPQNIIQEMNKMTGRENPDSPTQTATNTKFTNKVVIRNAYESCRKELIMVSRYLGYADMKDLLIIKNHLNVEKIRLLTSKHRADDSLKSDFKDFRDEMKQECNKDYKCEFNEFFIYKIIDREHQNTKSYSLPIITHKYNKYYIWN